MIFGVRTIKIIELVQSYVDGVCIYIPRKADSRCTWGGNTRYRQDINERNNNIFIDYKNGLKIHDLANKY